MCIGEVFAKKFPRMLTVVILLSSFHIFVFNFLIMTMNHFYKTINSLSLSPSLSLRIKSGLP